jgi:hypothetical protein
MMTRRWQSRQQLGEVGAVADNHKEDSCSYFCVGLETAVEKATENRRRDSGLGE